MNILETQSFRGPSVYSLNPVIRLSLDIEDLEARPSNLIEGFTERLMEMMPTLYEHRCSEGVAGGFLTRLREGTWAGHIVEHIALELQCLVGTEVGYGKTRSAEKEGVYNVIYSYIEEKVGLEAGRAAVRIVEHLADGAPLDYASELSRLSRILDDVAYGPSTQAIIDRARERDIPTIRLNDRNLVQLGHGKYQKRIEATVTSMTGLIATDIACDKELTKRMLDDAGIPVPKGRVVETVEEAQDVAESIGFPVVIKPLNANHGKGVAINLTNKEEVRQAFERAADYSRDVIVERYITGRDHRVLIVNNEVVAVAERVPAHVTGDGRSRLQELIEKENRNPMRGEGHEKALTKIFINEESERLIAEQGYTMESVPAEGATVWLKYTANISTGGTAVDRTDEIHHANVETAKRVARIIGLDIAGVDMLTTDITRPLEETGGAICEVNAAPGFRMHVHPTVGKSRDVAGAVLNMLYPPGSTARVPVVSITGTNGKTTTSRMLAHVLKMAGKKVGLTTTDGLYIDGKRVLQGDLTGPWSAQMVLRDPTVDFAVLETARGGILRAGLGFDYCDIGAILNVSEDHLGLRGIETLEELAYVKAIVVEVVRRDGYSILNAEDAHLVPLAERARGQLCYFSLDPDNEVLRNHLAQGGIGATLREHSIVIRRGSYDLPALNLNSIPATFNGRAMFNVANAMVAALGAHLSGVSLDDIRAGLKTFDTHFYLSPGRLNLEEVGDFHVLLDYAHNVAAYRNVAAFIAKLNVARRVGVIAAAGDRRDIDIETMGRIAGEAFDRLIIKEDDNLRGREAGETATIMKRGALEGGLAPEAIELCLDEREAVERALGQASKGDLVVITADDIKRTFDQIVKFRNERAARAAL
ncbi:MAG TPA: cyanophycin synthetase [Blastocatellia bacterium]|nr:cyanophycin synthetase [Blastocatellia bacterium]